MPLSYQTCLHVTPDPSFDIATARELLDSNHNIDVEMDTTDSEQSLHFTVYVNSNDDVYYSTAVPDDMKPNGGAELTPVRVTIHDDAEIRVTEDTETLRYESLLAVLRVILNDPLADLNIHDIDWAPILHYHNHSHAAVGGELLRRIFDETYHTEDPQIFSASVNGISFEISDWNIYPQIGTAVDAPVHAIGSTVEALFTEAVPDTSDTDVFDVPNFRDDWLDPALSLHEHSPRIIETLLESETTPITDAALDIVDTRNEAGIHHLATLLCFFHAFGVLTPQQRDELLSASHPITDYVENTTDVPLTEETDTIRLRERYDRGLSKLVRQQRLLEQWKSETRYTDTLETGDNVVVHATDTRQWLYTELTERRPFDGYEHLMDPVWFATVHQLSDYQGSEVPSGNGSHVPGTTREPGSESPDEIRPGAEIPVFHSLLHSRNPNPEDPFANVGIAVGEDPPGTN